MKYAVINKQTNKVQNIIIWDGKTPYNPGDKYFLVDAPDAEIGKIYDPTTKTFV